MMFVACTLDASDRTDVGLSEAGPGLDVPQKIPDLGQFIAADTGQLADASTLRDTGTSGDAQPAVIDAAVGPADVAISHDAAVSSDAQTEFMDAGMLATDTQYPPRDIGRGDAEDQPVSDAGMTVARLFGSVSDILSRRGIPNAEVCIQNRQPECPCARTGGGGQFSVDAPAGEDLVFVYSGGGILPTLVHLRLPLGMTRFNVQVLSQAMAPGLANGFGQQIDATKGYVSFTAGMAGNRGLVGVTGSINPGSGAGPFYLGANGFPDRNAVQTTSSGTGTFINVNPGMVNVSVTPPNTHRCAPYSLAVRQDSAWRVPIAAGHLSIAVFECTAR